MVWEVLNSVRTLRLLVRRLLRHLCGLDAGFDLVQQTGVVDQLAHADALSLRGLLKNLQSLKRLPQLGFKQGKACHLTQALQRDLLVQSVQHGGKHPVFFAALTAASPEKHG